MFSDCFLKKLFWVVDLTLRGWGWSSRPFSLFLLTASRTTAFHHHFLTEKFDSFFVSQNACDANCDAEKRQRRSRRRCQNNNKRKLGTFTWGRDNRKQTFKNKNKQLDNKAVKFVLTVQLFPCRVPPSNVAWNEDYVKNEEKGSHQRDGDNDAAREATLDIVRLERQRTFSDLKG